MCLTRRALFEGIGQVAAMSVAAAAAPAIVEKLSANVSQDELTASAKCTETDFIGADGGYRTRFSEA
ncbi:hypothetical protein [Bradyrhizobium cosmicum]|uniref:hypothetical protein n=1 Tax=Bradyrhizobium cosmicum TaxID=1404864 RepID=UPI0011655099|nr:hypothetical protein [Bradyrhizobium cosmicum]QDP26209.1 hypothetical protein FNV92_30400 [Bradyrhizobium cosmicum]